MGALTVGASLSTSGRYRLQGFQALAGLRAWADAVNAGRGIKVAGLGGPVPITLIHYDDASSPQRAAANVERLIAVERVHVLIGCYGSDLMRAAAKTAGVHGKVLWNHGGASDDIHGTADKVVGILTPASRYFEGLLDMVRRIDSDARSAVFLCRQNSTFGRLAAAGAAEAGRRLRFAVTGLPYSSLASDLPALLTQIRQQRPDLILGTGGFEDDCTLARELATAGVSARAFGFVGAALEMFHETLGDLAESFLAPSQWEASRWESGQECPVDFGPGPREVARRIRAAGAAPDYPACQAYAAGFIAQRCLEEAPGLDDGALWKAACALDCTIFFGRFRIEPDTGLQVGHEMVWIQWQDGRKVVVWPPERAAAPCRYPRV